MTILSQLTEDLTKRQALLRADRNRSTVYLKEYSADELIQIAYTHLLRGLERNGTLADIVTTIGRRIRQIHRLPQDSVTDAHTGWFVCISFIECQVIKYQLNYTYKNGKRSKHQSYHLVPVDWRAIKELWTLIDKTKVDMYPLREPASPWTKPIHDSGNTVIKKISPAAIKRFPDDPQWMVYEILNKLQRQSWAINREVFAVYQQSMRLLDAPSPFKATREVDWRKRKSLEMEIEAIEQIALANLNNEFFHLYNYDFRGRIYVNTAYLHEQSSDNAKGLLCFGTQVRFGRDGYYWLKIHTSNCFGNDKAKLIDRSNFVEDNFSKFVGFAEDPMNNRDWMSTDKPFMFLACCFELQKIERWLRAGASLGDFMSSLPLYIDGSNNGVQHLAALSLDEVVAPLVNLVPSELPGDVYKYIAGFTWDKLTTMASELTQEERDQFHSVYETAKSLQRAYTDAPGGSEAKALAWAAAAEWRNANRSIRAKLFSVYWLGVTEAKDRRKVVKRNVMTLGYGGTQYGMGQQIIDDTRDMSEYLRDKEHLWGALLGNLVYDTCYEKLPGPAMMLRLFESLAKLSSDRGEDLCWTAPITGFPIVQSYRKPKEIRVKLSYGEEELKIQLQQWETAVLDKSAQETGSSPNIVHSFDAAHLGTVVNSAKYPVSVVHDSFGCHAGNMHDLFHLVREKFLMFYSYDPLAMILEENNAMHLMPERGSLDINLILQSDFAFV